MNNVLHKKNTVESFLWLREAVSSNNGQLEEFKFDQPFFKRLVSYGERVFGIKNCKSCSMKKEDQEKFEQKAFEGKKVREVNLIERKNIFSTEKLNEFENKMSEVVECQNAAEYKKEVDKKFDKWPEIAEFVVLKASEEITAIKEIVNLMQNINEKGTVLSENVEEKLKKIKYNRRIVSQGIVETNFVKFMYDVYVNGLEAQ